MYAEALLQDVLNTSTIVPGMGTILNESMLGVELFGKARRAILALLYGHPDETFYTRQIARRTGLSPGEAQRELKLLTDAGIIERSAQGRYVFYGANRNCPIFSELQSMVVKTFGLADVLRGALAPLADRISVAFIFGSFAQGSQSGRSDVDVLVVGEVGFEEVVAVLRPAQDQLSRELNPAVYPSQEFAQKVKSGHHFLTTILEDPKVFLIGDESELAELG